MRSRLRRQGTEQIVHSQVYSTAGSRTRQQVDLAVDPSASGTAWQSGRSFNPAHTSSQEWRSSSAVVSRAQSARSNPSEAAHLLSPVLPSADDGKLHKLVSNLRVALTAAQLSQQHWQQQVTQIHEYFTKL